MKLWGGIEAGGTKFKCAVGSSPDNILDETTFRTESPGATLTKAINFFSSQQKKFGHLKAIGIGSFGPIDLNKNSSTFGFITSTPKPGWSHIDIVGIIKKELNVPVIFDTDVNVAALGEASWGAAQGLESFIYLTVGTGIGGGGMVGGKLIHGLLHPEMGHIPIPHDAKDDPYTGFCPFHGNCLEGLAAGPAIEKRWGKKVEELPIEHPAWNLEAKYLALGLVNYICILSPEIIIMGGGVMKQKQLFPLIQRNVLKILNDYIKTKKIINNIEDYIVPPKLGEKSGMLGAIVLAKLF